MKVSKVNHPVVIISRLKNSDDGVLIAPKITIQKPVTFFYNDSKKIPWNYEYNVAIPRRETLAGASKEDQGIVFHIYSGKHYDVISPKIEPIKGQAITEQKKGETVDPVNESVREEEAKEFLKFLKHSEYSVVE
ncbi:hypothetical protein Goshw_016563 [Gossypium schwendimanii]|uniref:Uncharacterized protein n=1 Tax=Gossypium schwendimanii TaxID=34291 RepID=A0A7J9N1E9_GOSSC|nr:hypothetical protein [Gossypium schwendimanii]